MSIFNNKNVTTQPYSLKKYYKLMCRKIINKHERSRAF